MSRSMDALCKLELKANKADLPSVLSALELAQNNINSIEVTSTLKRRKKVFLLLFCIQNSRRSFHLYLCMLLKFLNKT